MSSFTADDATATADPVPAPTSTLARALPLPGSSTSSSSSTTIPRLIYGTAWKKDATADLVYEAIRAGFRAVDTAAQPRHYREDLVAEGIRRAISEGIVSREDLWIQTKFTPPSGQDLSDMPYDPSAPLEDQVDASIASSLRNFTFPSSSSPSASSEPYIDSLILHSPLPTTRATLAVWARLASYLPDRIRHLGISNTDLATLSALLPSTAAAPPSTSPSPPPAIPPPSIVQNRFYPSTGYDVPLRALCRARSLVYQSFWTLTGNPALLRLPCAAGLASRAGVAPEVALYALVLGLGRTAVLDGTRTRMREDLAGVESVGRWADEFPGEWNGFLDAFRGYIHEDAA